MPSTQGFVKCDGSSLVGTFTVDGNPYYLSVVVKPHKQPFECRDAALIFGNIIQLSGNCNWSGPIGKDDLHMDFIGGVTISGKLTTRLRSSIQSHGAGTWSALEMTSSVPQARSTDENDESLSSLNNVNYYDPSQDVARVAREQQLVNSGVPIITIYGQSGTGKSSFVNLITSEKQKVGKGLHSCTSEISVSEARVEGQPVVIIDTPGIDDTRAGVKEADVFISIAKHLEKMGEKRIWVTGVLFMHRISDNKFSQTADHVSNVLKNLCGDAAMNHLMLCTTMWDKVDWDEGYGRFDELCEMGAWKEMIDGGASTAAISNKSSNAKAEAEAIISRLIKNAKPVEVAIQDEMVKQKLKVVETRAGRVLDEHLREMQAEAERELKKMRERLQNENDVNAAKAREAIRAQELAVERMKAQAEEQARQRVAQMEQLKREQEKFKREMKAMKEQMRRESDVNAAREEELRAREKEFALLKQQANEATGKGKRDATQLKLERKRAEQARKETKKNAKKEAAARAAKAKKETLAQLREIKVAKKQVETLAGTSQNGPGILRRLGLI